MMETGRAATGPERAVELSFILIAWNSQGYLERCLESVVAKCRGEGIGFEIVLVDNGSRDATVQAIKDFGRRCPGCLRYLVLERNGGTTFSRNIALRAARGRFLCVLDSDTEMKDGSLRSLLQLLELDASLGLAVPRLLLPDGTVQHSVKPFPTCWQKLRKLPGILLRTGVTNGDLYADFPFEGDTEVDSAISACWFMRRELTQEIGLLDEKIFYSPEDLDYCQRVHKAGYRILYSPSLTVLHHTQQISHRKPFSRTSLTHLRGLFYYYAKHGGWLRNSSLTRSP